MIKYEKIKAVHLELSTNCNASCPLCPRNFAGMEYNSGYPITELSIADIKQIFSIDFVKQLTSVLINGNLGDFMLARDALEIVEYFKTTNPRLQITISTNGSARNSDFWSKLGSFYPTIDFCLDGLEDTHSIYRKDTQFNTILKNAQTFMSAGGRAHWKMIKFDHNEHQIEECRALAKKLGFAKFNLVDHGRNNSHVYDRKGNYLYSIGEQSNEVQAAEETMHWMTVNFYEKNHYKDQIHQNISCDTVNNKMIYISANGDVSPCCYLGFYPETYSPELMIGNDEIKSLLQGATINAKEKPLEECIEWFNLVEATWSKTSFEEGRLWRCNHHCGSSI